MSLEDLDSYDLLLVAPGKDRFYVRRHKGRLILPNISIRRQRRPAEEITTTIREQLGATGIVIDWIPSESHPIAVIELFSYPSIAQTPPLCTLSLNRLADAAIDDQIQSTLYEMLAGVAGSRGPFSRFGWIQEALGWLATTTGHDGLTVANVSQFNASGSFALLRIGSANRHAFWLKAVGPPNLQEFTITRYLVDHCSGMLPRVLAMRPTWNAWLMEDFGNTLRSSELELAAPLAAETLGLLQRSLLNHTEELLDAQFCDHREATLEARVDALVEYFAEIMHKQTSTRVPRLTASQLETMRRALHTCCTASRGLHIPDSVLHSDISPGSILIANHKCVFTDWSEGGVGNPFITFEQLCVHIRQLARKDSDHLVEKMVSIYRSCWGRILTDKQFDEALRHSRLLSLLSYTLGHSWDLRSEWISNPHVESYSRSLARHMARTIPELYGGDA